MIAAARVILAFVGGVTILVGLGLIVTDGDRSTGLFTILIGAAVLIAVVYERSRYRSVEADLRNDAPGPGGGEPVGALPPGFRATTEVFVDPSSGRRMRVYLQPATGDRRYMAED
ncbi:MAG: hypothetical protein ACRDGI_03940 [Candidatus Limnocylindrales bacterium]